MSRCNDVWLVWTSCSTHNGGAIDGRMCVGSIFISSVYKEGVIVVFCLESANFMLSLSGNQFERTMLSTVFDEIQIRSCLNITIIPDGFTTSMTLNYIITIQSDSEIT